MFLLKIIKDSKSYYKSVGVQNLEKLLSTGEYHGELKKGSGIWGGPKWDD